MANIGKVLKDEMNRLARKHALAMAKPMRHELRGLKLQLRAMAAAQAALKKAVPAAVQAPAEEETPVRGITGKGVKSLRRKLKLTQAELARLAKVSSQAVVMWERKTGKIRLRHATQTALQQVRAMSRAQVKEALGQTSATKKAVSKKAVTKKVETAKPEAKSA